MKLFIIAVFIICLTGWRVEATSDFEQTLLQEDPVILQQWQDFVSEHEKYYGSIEEMMERYEIFKNNLDLADQLGQIDTGAQYGVTQFMDLSQKEFRQQYLTLQSEDIDQNLEILDIDINVEDTPESYDWREHGAVTAVKNQAQCGSCWAFSTIANLEGQYFLNNNTLTSFSEQELVDCDKKQDQGCNGGLMQNAFKWLETNGFEKESDYPYKGRDGTCKLDKSKAVGTVKSFYLVDKDETKIAATLAQVGPLSAAVNAAHFQMYMGGIMDPLLCDKKSLDHGITLVGYGSEKAKDFWLIKNSWGPSWGEKGYIRLKRGSGTCGINTNVVTSQL